MSVRAKILERLSKSKNLSVERVVESALTQGGRGTACEKELAEVLFKRGTRGGRVALVKSFDRLSADAREKLLSEPRELFGALSEAMQDSEGLARPNAIEIVRQSGNSRLVYLLAEALIDSREEVREAAGSSLLAAVRTHRERAESCISDEVEETEETEHLRKAVGAALKQFKTHKQQAALLAALYFERQQDSPMWSYFCDPHDELTKAAMAMLRTPPAGAGAGLATGMLLALTTSLKPAAMAGISGTEDAALTRALAKESYRLLDPVLREVAQGIGHVKGLALAWKESPANEITWSHWLRLIDAVGMQAMDRVTWLGQVLERASTAMESGAEMAVAWKLSVMQSLAATGMPEAGKMLARMMADSDERVARVAARHLLGRRNGEWRGLAGSVESPHASVRRLVGSAGGEGSGRNSTLVAVVASTAAVAAGENGGAVEPKFAPVWGEYPKMPPVVQGNTARASSEVDPEFAAQLKEKLGSSQTAEVAQGLKMLGALRDVSPYRTQIIGLCGHADVRVAAAAVKLIGKLEDPRLKDLLDAAAQHADTRVRANAVEAMEVLHIAKSSKFVMAMLNSRHNRERANAIKAISEFDFLTARDCLARMLADPNPLHRVSALWVVEQLKLSALFRQVAVAGRKDSNMRVRKRAAEMFETLTGNTNSLQG